MNFEYEARLRKDLELLTPAEAVEFMERLVRIRYRMAELSRRGSSSLRAKRMERLQIAKKILRECQERLAAEKDVPATSLEFDLGDVVRDFKASEAKEKAAKRAEDLAREIRNLPVSGKLTPCEMAERFAAFDDTQKAMFFIAITRNK